MQKLKGILSILEKEKKSANKILLVKCFFSFWYASNKKRQAILKKERLSGEQAVEK